MFVMAGRWSQGGDVFCDISVDPSYPLALSSDPGSNGMLFFAAARDLDNQLGKRLTSESRTVRRREAEKDSHRRCVGS